MRIRKVRSTRSDKPPRQAGRAISAQRPSRQIAPRLLRLGLVALALLPFVMLGCYHLISWQGRKGIYQDLAALPYRKYALLLGTGPKAPSGRPNLYFVYRIRAAAALWHAGKYSYIIASGSRRSGKGWVYDEIAAMRRDLIAAGVPASRILADPQAHDTRLSIERAASEFGLRDYLIISQRFHCERALFIARDLGQRPICFGSQDLRRRYPMLLRETVSRLVAVAEALIK